jgi:hypothetical protein
MTQKITVSQRGIRIVLSRLTHKRELCIRLRMADGPDRAASLPRQRLPGRQSRAIADEPTKRWGDDEASLWPNSRPGVFGSWRFLGSGWRPPSSAH